MQLSPIRYIGTAKQMTSFLTWTNELGGLVRRVTPLLFRNSLNIRWFANWILALYPHVACAAVGVGMCQHVTVWAAARIGHLSSHPMHWTTLTMMSGGL